MTTGYYTTIVQLEGITAAWRPTLFFSLPQNLFLTWTRRDFHAAWNNTFLSSQSARPVCISDKDVSKFYSVIPLNYMFYMCSRSQLFISLRFILNKLVYEVSNAGFTHYGSDDFVNWNQLQNNRITQVTSQTPTALQR